jgi:CheY-like chemotaxis protein
VLSSPVAGPSVLVVEDNDTTRAHITTLLQSNGYATAEATDGLDALQKLGRDRYDAIVLDLVLPHVDGWQLRATQLRHPELAEIPTVIVTIQPLQPPHRYALRAADVIQKPFEDADLLARVQHACRSRRPRRDSGAGSVVEGLFWSRRGEVACVDHAPDATSDRWTAERWAAIPASAGMGRIAYRCQHCSPTPIRRRSRAKRDMVE